VREEAQRPDRGDRDVELAQRPRRGVARVGIGPLARRRRARVHQGEVGLGDVDLAADLDDGGHAGCRLQPLRHVGERPQIGGDVLAGRAVAARRPADQHAVLVTQARRQPVDLGLGGQRHLGVRREVEKAPHPRHELENCGIVEGIVDAEHRPRMDHLAELRRHTCADRERRRVRPHQLGIRRLQLGIAPHERVIVGVGDRRSVVAVIARRMIRDFRG